MAINALNRSAIQRSLRDLENHIGGATHIGVRAAGSALARAMRKQLAARGGKDEFSSPGRPPLKKSGRLQKSIGTQNVEGVLRVGSGHFVARIMEQGAIIPPEGEASPERASKSGRKGRRYPKGRIMKPRPFMAKALEKAKPKMTEAAVSDMRGQADFGNTRSLVTGGSG